MLFSKKCAIGLILLLLVLVACVPILIANSWQQERRHFRAVREGVFYRSGQMTLKGLSWSVHDHGIKSVVTFRASNRSDKPNPDAEEENWCKGEGLKYLRLAPLHWQDSEGGPAPVEENLKKYLDFLSNKSNYPILIHCFAGIHRTGAYCAIYRMEVEGWDRGRAMNEMKACGYVTLEENEDILRYLSNYKSGQLRSGLPKLSIGSTPLWPYGNLSPGEKTESGVKQ